MTPAPIAGPVPAPSGGWSGRERLTVAVLLVIFAAACMQFSWTTSPTFDEPGLIHAGYAGLTAGATKSYTANLIFAQTWAALPLLVTRPVLPSEDDLRNVDPAQRELGRLFLYHPANDWRAIVRPARAMNILLGVLLGLVVYAWSRTLAGNAGATVALSFYCLSPTLLANSSLATTDLAAALWLTIAVQRWWTLLHRISPWTVATCGVATGLALVTKFSALALGPLVVVLLVVRLIARRPLAVVRPGLREMEVSAPPAQFAWCLAAGGAVAAIVVATLWLAYAPQSVLFPENAPPQVAWEALPHQSAVARVADWFHRWHLLPEPYLRDLWLFDATTGGRRAYLLGNYSVTGWWYFFPVAWWCKTPVPFLLALGLAGVAAWRCRDRYALTPLIAWVIIFGGAAMQSGLNIGIRHLLPVYPALFIGTGLIAAGPWSRRAGRIGPAVLIAWSVAELWPVRSEYLAYFNVFAGGPGNGHRVLVDSSYEWGQDLPAVERWLAERAQRSTERRPVYFSYFGNADLSRYRIDAVLLPQFFELRPVRAYELEPGTYVISATMLHSVYGPLFGPWRASHERVYQSLLAELSPPGRAPLGGAERARYALFDALRFGRLCAHLRRREPDARVTHGVLVFEVTAADLDAALRLPVPEGSSDYQVPHTEHLPQSAVEFLK